MYTIINPTSYSHDLMWVVGKIICAAFYLFVYPLLFMSLLLFSSSFASLVHWFSGHWISDWETLSRNLISWFWCNLGRIYNGYKIVNVQNIPRTGPALLIYYHGPLPIDLIYITAHLQFHHDIQLHSVADRFLFSVPLLGTLLKLFNVFPGTSDDCLRRLDLGHLVAVSPGGVREAYFSRNDRYNLVWGSRKGYASLALQSRCPVVVMFTSNVRQLAYCYHWPNRLFKYVYELTRLPLIPIFGFWPVQLTTYVSEPFHPTALDTVETIDELVRSRLMLLISDHQKLPTSTFSALLDRFL